MKEEKYKVVKSAAVGTECRAGRLENLCRIEYGQN